MRWNKNKLEPPPLGCMPPQTSQNAVTVYVHVCPDLYVEMTVDNAPNMDVVAKKLHILKRGCFTHFQPSST